MKIAPRRLKFYGLRHIEKLKHLQKLSEDDRFAMKVVSQVLPFRTNNYVIEELIDWDAVPDDPIYQLTFMQKAMLRPRHFNRMAALLKKNAPQEEIDEASREIRMDLNPHPAGQMTANVPLLDEDVVPGVQHKYRETSLVFPSSGQTCHAYCTFCFRWPQFVGMDDLKFATDESKRFQDYLRIRTEISDVLLTGGDPMVMSARKLATYVEPLLEPEFDHIQTIRIGTKSIAYWPYKYVTDKDADDVLRLFEKIVASGKHLAIMGHYNHWQEFNTDIAQEAIRRIRNTGAQIRTQSPLIRHINDSAVVWARMWKDQVRLGLVPYYMFVERNTGAKAYFAVPLSKAYEIYIGAYRQVSGLARTARGPSMSALPGKVCIEGITKVHGEKVFALTLLQARNPEWCKRPFFAKYDPKAIWLTDLEPAFGEADFFYDSELQDILTRTAAPWPEVDGQWDNLPPSAGDGAAFPIPV